MIKISEKTNHRPFLTHKVFHSVALHVGPVTHICGLLRNQDTVLVLEWVGFPCPPIGCLYGLPG